MKLQDGSVEEAADQAEAILAPLQQALPGDLERAVRRFIGGRDPAGSSTSHRKEMLDLSRSYGYL